MKQPVVIRPGDYVSPGLKVLAPDPLFPHLRAIDPRTVAAPWFRREIPHAGLFDQRRLNIPLLNRDEANLLFNSALQFPGQRALQLGGGMGWSAIHTASAGVQLCLLDPELANTDYQSAVTEPLAGAGLLPQVNMQSAASPADIHAAAAKLKSPWSLFFLDWQPEMALSQATLEACVAHAAADALILFSNLVVPQVADLWKSLQKQGWQIRLYHTTQMMGVAWRGRAKPVEHWPDPGVLWPVPAHLKGFPISGWHNGIYGDFLTDEFNYLTQMARPFTVLCTRRLACLYTLVRHVCLADLPGNIVECGTYRGGVAAFMARVAKQYSRRMRTTFACDTFEGMPEPTGADRHAGIPANETHWGVGTLAAPASVFLEDVCRTMEVADRVVAVKGLFAETLPAKKSEMGTIAVLHFDGDWYQSAMDVFENLYDQVLPGGFIQIDDYEYWEGCRKAVQDFDRQRGLGFFLNSLDGRAVWLRKSAV